MPRVDPFRSHDLDLCPACGEVRCTVRDGRVVAVRVDGGGECCCALADRLVAALPAPPRAPHDWIAALLEPSAGASASRLPLC